MSGAPLGGPSPERGMVFQDYGLFPWLTVRGNIAFGPISRQGPAGDVKRTVDRLGCSDLPTPIRTSFRVG